MGTTLSLLGTVLIKIPMQSFLNAFHYVRAQSHGKRLCSSVATSTAHAKTGRLVPRSEGAARIQNPGSGKDKAGMELCTGQAWVTIDGPFQKEKWTGAESCQSF